MLTPNSSQSSSLMSRREIRLRAVNATTARLQPRPKRRLANDPERRSGPFPAPRATQPLSAMLGVHDRDRRQLGDLMTPRPVTRNLLAIGELPPASPTLIGVMVNDLLHPILRQ
jgi:hypothetical protein